MTLRTVARGTENPHYTLGIYIGIIIQYMHCVASLCITMSGPSGSTVEGLGHKFPLGCSKMSVYWGTVLLKSGQSVYK